MLDTVIKLYGMLAMIGAVNAQALRDFVVSTWPSHERQARTSVLTAS
jgi:hypothetical protein